MESTFLARRDDGSRRVSLSRIGAFAAAALISQLWQPTSRDRLRNAAINFGAGMALRPVFNVGAGILAPEVKPLKIGDLLRPHSKALAAGLLAAIGEGTADLLQPWPIKIVFDDVLQTRQPNHHGWFNHQLVSLVGTDRLVMLKLAAIAALAIAVVGALCSFAEKYFRRASASGSCTISGGRFTLTSRGCRFSTTTTNGRGT